jgi:hypothetical protein
MNERLWKRNPDSELMPRGPFLLPLIAPLLPEEKKVGPEPSPGRCKVMKEVEDISTPTDNDPFRELMRQWPARLAKREMAFPPGRVAWGRIFFQAHRGRGT